MATALSFLTIGVALGLSAGLSPGPLLTLMVAESLQHGARAGIKIAVAPLLTDLPIVALAVFSLYHLADIDVVLGMISLIGAVVLAHYGWKNVRFNGVVVNAEKLEPRSFRKGVIANLSNPNPYLFWFSVGAPTTLKALEAGTAPALLFILSFYAVLVGSKSLLALLIGTSRHLLRSHTYTLFIKTLGTLLLLFAALFTREGLRLLGWI
jgi:threonine/homoserine/homoserine lactone efflux protein